jgi:hypothetical protein
MIIHIPREIRTHDPIDQVVEESRHLKPQSYYGWEIIVWYSILFLFFCKTTKDILLPSTSRGYEYFSYALLERHTMFLVFKLFLMGTNI